MASNARRYNERGSGISFCILNSKFCIGKGVLPVAKKKTPVEKMGSAIEKMLSEYDGAIRDNLDTITRKMGAKGVAALKDASKRTFKQHSGKYVKGWKYEFRKTKRNRRGSTTIFNEEYGMPHLLENDHVIKDGTGRVVGEYKGRPHIAPIAEALTETYQEEVIRQL